MLVERRCPVGTAPRRVVGLGLMGYSGEVQRSRSAPRDVHRLPRVSRRLRGMASRARLRHQAAARRRRLDRDRGVQVGPPGPAGKLRRGPHHRAADQRRFEDLLAGLAATDVVVATRFHNVLMAMLLNKPVIAISFHHKCSSLMRQMGLSDYCHDIHQMDADRLIGQFRKLEQEREAVKRHDRAGRRRGAGRRSTSSTSSCSPARERRLEELTCLAAGISGSGSSAPSSA